MDSRTQAALEGTLKPDAERKAWAIKARVKQRLAALPWEAKLGLYEDKEPKGATLHISNSTIGNLNLGAVGGDLVSSIQQLSNEGHDDLAKRFEEFTKAINSSADFQEGMKKDLLEHLVVVAEEAAKPSEKRRMGPLRTSIEAIKTGIGMAAQLAAIWGGIDLALKAAGIIHN